MRVVGNGLSTLCLTIMAVAMMGALPCSAQAAVKAAAKSSKPADKVALAAHKASPQANLAPMNFTLAADPAKPTSLTLRDGRPAAGFMPREVDSPAAQVEGAFALSPAAAYGDARLLDADRYYDGRGPVSWRSNAFVVGEKPGVVDSVRVSVANVSRTAATAPLTLVRPDADTFEADDIDVTLTRGWPSAVKFATRKYALDVTPHAGFGFGDAGGSAEAGATVRLGKNMEDRVSDSLGLRDGSEAFGQRGRWYVFAAASGRAVGMNMLRGQDGDWSRAGLSSDVSSKLIGDSQAGVAWRRGPMQASLGYIHREMKAKDQIMGMATQKDSMVALSFSLKPHW